MGRARNYQIAKTAALRQQEYRERYPDRARENCKRYYRTVKGTVRCLLRNAKDTAQRKGLDFNLDEEWLFQKVEAGVCEVTGLTLVKEWDTGVSRTPFTPSLDKIDPHKGYTEDSTRLVCFIFNVCKNEWSDDVVKKFATALLTNTV